MKRLSIFGFLNLLLFSACAQMQLKVVDVATGEPLPAASIILFSSAKRAGLVANKDGIFSLSHMYDSVRISMIGYCSKTIFPKYLSGSNHFEIKLESVAAELDEVIVKKTTALDIIKKTIAAIPSFQPSDNFENKGFYREIIKDKENYFSVAEAVFLAQYFPKKGAYKLKLEQGRSKEDVSYTRLFEDYHPGGGPQSAASKEFLIELPDFLVEKKIKYFTYKIDSLVQYDGQWLYSISFDQKPDIKQALEKGTILIDADKYAVIRYEAENSPIGTPYIKDLTGSDKIFAEILNVSLKRNGWKHRVDFVTIDDKCLLSHVESERRISYKQDKKNIDLDLTINSELLFTELGTPIQKEIAKDEEWKRKELVRNFPSAFDASFWGDKNIIAPTEQVKNIVEKISKNNKESTTTATSIKDWEYLNRNLFLSYQKDDTITIVPIMKCWWEDEKKGGMLFKELEGNFIIETKLNITKSNSTGLPDHGFQQAGLMVRNTNDGKENYIFLSIGTGGSPAPKILLKKTSGNKSKTFAEKIENMEQWLRIEKKGKKLIAFYKSSLNDGYKKIDEYEAEWLKNKIQLGLASYTGFPGDGPKMKPDMKVEFTQLRIEE